MTEATRGPTGASPDDAGGAGAAPGVASDDAADPPLRPSAWPAASPRLTALAWRAQSGDHEALLLLHQALAQRHAARVWRRHACRSDGCGGLERADLEQQAFLVLVEALRTWPGAGDFAAWFVRAARWNLRRYARRWLRPAPASPDPGEPDHALAAVERVHWMALLAQLPAPERAVLRWRFWQDLTYEQIAARYGIPPATAYHRYCSALAHLRRLLGMAAARRRPGRGVAERPRERGHLAR